MPDHHTAHVSPSCPERAAAATAPKLGLAGLAWHEENWEFGLPSLTKNTYTQSLKALCS